MRVLHVAECGGGVDRYLHCLIKYSLSENIVILSQLYKKEKYDAIADKVEIMEMSHSIGIKSFISALQLRKKIQKYKPDIVYAHSSIAGAITRMACIGLKCKVIYNPHGWSFNMENGKKKVFIFLEKLMSHFCDAIICISEAEKISALKNKICQEKKLHVIYNGISIEEYKEENVELPIPDGVHVVGMVGRICKQKAPDVFVKMAASVHKRIPNTFFVIVGDVLEGAVEERREIENLAKELGIDLLITGWVNNPLAYMRKFDVGCLLSRWEGFGLAIPEYMLSEVPVVATRVDAIPYLINDGENGLLVDKDNWNDAAQKVIKILENHALKQKLINNGKVDVRKRFDARRVSEECEKLYRELLR